VRRRHPAGFWTVAVGGEEQFQKGVYTLVPKETTRTVRAAAYRAGRYLLAVVGCHLIRETRVRNAFDGVAGNGVADSARHTTACHITQEPSVRNAFDDVTTRARLEAGIQLLSV